MFYSVLIQGSKHDGKNWSNFFYQWSNCLISHSPPAFCYNLLWIKLYQSSNLTPVSFLRNQDLTNTRTSKWLHSITAFKNKCKFLLVAVILLHSSAFQQSSDVKHPCALIAVLSGASNQHQRAFWKHLLIFWHPITTFYGNFPENLQLTFIHNLPKQHQNDKEPSNTFC